MSFTDNEVAEMFRFANRLISSTEAPLAASISSAGTSRNSGTSASSGARSSTESRGGPGASSTSPPPANSTGHCAEGTD